MGTVLCPRTPHNKNMIHKYYDVLLILCSVPFRFVGWVTIHPEPWDVSDPRSLLEVGSPACNYPPSQPLFLPLPPSLSMPQTPVLT